MATSLQQKQISVLTMNTLAFAVNFAVWTMFSIIGIRIKQQLNLNETEFGLLVATPVRWSGCRSAFSRTALADALFSLFR